MPKFPIRRRSVKYDLQNAKFKMLIDKSADEHGPE